MRQHLAALHRIAQLRIDGAAARSYPPRMAMVVVYDADCGVCQASVAWIRERSAAGALLRAPGLRQLGNLGYDAFARRRHKISAALGMRACAVPKR